MKENAQMQSTKLASVPSGSVSLLRPLDALDRVLEELAQSEKATCFVADDSGRLVGSITNGDILKRAVELGKIPETAGEVVNRTPFTISSTDAITDSVKLRVKELKIVPVVSNAGIVLDFLTTAETVIDEVTLLDWTVLIMAGGEGRRLRPMTHELPKPLLSVGGRPMISHIIEKLSREGFSKFLISAGYLGSKVSEYIDDQTYPGLEISVIQEERPLGTAGALQLVPEGVEKILMVNGDVLTTADFRNFVRKHEESRGPLSMMSRQVQHSIEFGVINTDNDSRLTSIDEKPTLIHDVNCGVYALNKSMIEKHLVLGQPMSAVDLISDLLLAHQPVTVVENDAMWMDVGRPQDLNLADKIFSRFEFG